MAKFKIECMDTQGGARWLAYDSKASVLTYEDGTPVVRELPDEEKRRMKSTKIRLGEVARKVREIKFLRIVLGTKCNYKCAYCSQAFDAPEEQSTTIEDAKTFLARMDEWLFSEPKRIELWGGEPLVYIKWLRIVLPALRKKFPNSQISTITNGSLLTDEIVDFLVENRCVFSVSHDAYGQSMRGEDILDDPEKVRIIDRAERLVHEAHYPLRCFGFNVTYNKKVLDPIRAKAYFTQKFGRDIAMSSDPVLAVGRAEVDAETVPAGELLEDFARNVATATLLPPELSSYSLFRYGNMFIQSLAERLSLVNVGQKCDIDRDSSLVVDVKGNVYTCQNFVKVKDVKGSVYDFDNIKVNNLQHFSNRKSCMSCPYAHMCMGGCPAIQGNGFAGTCEIKFAFFSGIFVSTIASLTGLLPRRIIADDVIYYPQRELIETAHGKHVEIKDVLLPVPDFERVQKLSEAALAARVTSRRPSAATSKAASGTRAAATV